MMHSCAWIKATRRVWGAAIFLVLVTGCTPVLYSVDMHYLSNTGFRKAEALSPPMAVTVALFQDLRPTKDPMRIGTVITSSGKEVPVLPKFRQPAQVVTAPFRDFFRRGGYRVSDETPSWDLQEASIKKEWGPILIGGSIDALEVLCRRSATVERYTARTKLTLYVADTRQRKILYKVSTQSTDSLDHILFSEDKLEDQLNIALSEAINKILEDKGLAKVLREIAAQPSPEEGQEDQ